MKRIDMKMTTLFYRAHVNRITWLFSMAWVVCYLSFPPLVCANSIVGAPVDWDTPATTPTVPWTALDGDATVGEVVGANDYLEISFASTAIPLGDSWGETAVGSASDLFAGTWITDNWIEFDFWSETTVPTTLQIRWGVDGGRTWANTVTPSGVGGWDTLHTDSFSNFANWNLGPFVTEQNFVDDLVDIDWIGVYIYRPDSDPQIYRVDNFRLMVPEPEAYLMLAMALVTAFLVMRRKRSTSDTVQLA